MNKPDFAISALARTGLRDTSMHRNPQTAEEWRTWVTRRQVMAVIDKLEPCLNGHTDCSTHAGGPCFSTVVQRISDKARVRALQLVAGGSERGEMWDIISREYPTLDERAVERVVEAALSFGAA